MRLVLAALSRPMTVVIALIAIALCAVLALERMPVDIFPQVGDPAIYVAQPYGGMDPAQMEGYLTRITTSITSSTSPASTTWRARAYKARPS
jgi:multidrug efflux pump subunit AcrB